MKKWISKVLSEDEIKKISEAVALAESKTSGEIVPIIAKRSSQVGHVKWLLTLFLMLVFIASESFYLHNQWGFVAMIWPVLAFIALYALSHVLAQLAWWQRLLTTEEDEINSVNIRAELEFHRTEMKKTAGGTGILIFVSWMEKRIVVLADQGIAHHYPQETWNEINKLMTDEFKKGHVYAGFEKAIQRCGEILQAKLPAAHHDTNELANQLIIKE